jgi:N-acetylglucosamine kinase-like BadF-type ATPase
VDVVLGIDGGNSKTLALVADTDGRALGFARAGGSNHEQIGFAEAEVVLGRVAREGICLAGIEPPADFAFWGLAGADVSSDFEALDAVVRRIGAARGNAVANDLAAAMSAGLSRGWGVGVVYGAGFSAGGIAPDGRKLKFPSMGAATGDWGGGGILAMEVLRLAHRSYDGRGETSTLEESVLDALGIASYEELPTRIRDEAIDWEAACGTLPPLLFEAAAAGDKVARGLVSLVGEEVGTTAVALIRRLGLKETDVEVVLGGSVLRGGGALLLETVWNTIRRSAPRARIVLPEFRPVVGAVFEAIRKLGITVDDRIRVNMRESLPAELLDARLEYGE